MSESESRENSVHSPGESAVHAADLRDLIAAATRKQARIFILSSAAIAILIWVGLEATTPLIAMAAALVAILPLKAALRQYVALRARKNQLLSVISPEGTESS